MDTARTMTPDVTQLKALAHPLRLQLLGQLRLHGASTASRLAAVVGESSGSTSYHLRQLARHGFVEEEDRPGTGRERWWKPTTSFTTTEDWPQDVAGREAVGAFVHVVTAVYASTAQRAVAEQATLPPQWAELMTSNDAAVRVTAEQAARIRDRFQQLVGQVVDEYPAPTDQTSDDARLYQVQVQMFTSPGQRHE